MKMIVDIIDRMQQGQCEAVLCMADDDQRYVVKSENAGRLALVREWVASSIGRDMGLPIPPFEMASVDSSLARYMVHPEAKALARCPAFASQFVEQAIQLPPTAVNDVDSALRARVLLFDWWVMNGDRTDGNPNLLWLAHKKSLHVIDHNLAFDLTEDAADFWEHHIFRHDRNLWNADFQRETKPIMRRILDMLPKAWANLPEEWTDRCILTPEQVETILRRYENQDFWSAP